jgi:hypothetical protein
MGKKSIRLRLESLKTDPVQYKPFDITFTPADDVQVLVELEDDQVLYAEEDGILITPAGAANISKQIAQAVYGMWWEFERWKQAQGR